ncbi:hypothetical protein L6164_023605 [Bauhinia variegata]|uniref:Uncharacterized protein n=1 Tax=Bauhinia variegata TaxID=167791 RepID=A0ACB9MJ14_BAUVA|nr:hypothetical protein L6164_023605 [Bauhinia variegata]
MVTGIGGSMRASIPYALSAAIMRPKNKESSDGGLNELNDNGSNFHIGSCKANSSSQVIHLGRRSSQTKPRDARYSSMTQRGNNPFSYPKAMQGHIVTPNHAVNATLQQHSQGNIISDVVLFQFGWRPLDNIADSNMT